MTLFRTHNVIDKAPKTPHVFNPPVKDPFYNGGSKVVVNGTTKSGYKVGR